MKNHNTEYGAVIKLWLFFRVVTSLVAMVSSGPRPWTIIEKQLPLWPPSMKVGEWLYRILIAPWLRWDADWYERILVQGYKAGDGTTSFHPLYPWFSQLFYKLGLDPVVSLIVVSNISTLVLFFAFYSLAKLDLEKGDAFIALVLFMSFPVSFIFFAPYTESMFLLWVVLAFYNLRLVQWNFVALFTFLAALTRQQGVLLAFPIVWMAWTSTEKSWANFKQHIGEVTMALIAAPAGLIFWAIYRITYLGEGAVDLTNSQSFLYSALVSPSAKIVVSGQAFLWPWQALYLALLKVIASSDLGTFVDLFLGAAFVILFVVAWPKLQGYDCLYALIVILISLSAHTGPIHPYMSLPRHLIIAPSVFIGMAARLHNVPKQTLWLIIGQFTGMIFMVILYVWHAWVP
jgi:hypothetical protein